MNLPPHYNSSQIEEKWYQYWLQQGFFKAQPNPNKASYTIVMPPPNVTGVLHMGHVLNNTIQDVLIRRARMQGQEACWVPGLDHAAVATEAKVVAMLRERGITKRDLGRGKFLQYAQAWKNKYGGIILEQLKQLGVSCDWERNCFTMDPGLSASVYKVFIQLYEQGYIYRGTRMINWDPASKTALSDEEVNYKAVDSKLYYIRYAISDSDQQIMIATTRPETILGDTAICIHPADTRYQYLQGKQAWVPIVDRMVPIIADAQANRYFGTGCFKVTPAHDMNDYKLAQKHKLEIIDILNQDGTISQAAQYFVGENRFVAREKIIQQLQAQNYLVKVEAHTSNIGFSERTDAIVEPRISTQWFVRMQELAKPALQHVLDNTIQFYPAKFKNMYQAWLENVQDWCISRQLWWGHRIPAFYLPDGAVIVAKDAATALAKAKVQLGTQDLMVEDLRQDEDVLDTWFSSWIWPISVFDGLQNPNNAAMRYFYPTNDLVTAPEIIFFWVARMIMAGYMFTGKPPFKHVYFTGIVRDKLGRKMSKSLGNSPDPLGLIQQYGADGVRVGMLFSAPAGNDLLFDTKLCEQGRNFSNKLWNAFRLIQRWADNNQPDQSSDTIAIQWFEVRLNQALVKIEQHFEHFRISDALMDIYKLIWDDFCAWYLEMVKPVYGELPALSTYQATIDFLAKLLRLLHPFMPFITEELWHHLQVRSARDSIIIAPWPQATSHNPLLLQEAALAFELVTQIRNLRKKSQLSPKQALSIYSEQVLPPWLTRWGSYVQKLAHINPIVANSPQKSKVMRFIIHRYPFWVPWQQSIDLVQEQERLHQELVYYQGFLAVVEKKLNNERFLQQAPQPVIALEYKKQQDTIAKIQRLKQHIAVYQADPMEKVRPAGEV